MNIGMNVEVVYQGAENEMMDNIMTHTVTVPEGNVEMTYTFHSKPKLQIARIGKFREVEFVQVKNMPRSILDQSYAWHYALREVRRAARGMGWLALRLDHKSDLLDLAIYHGFIPAVDDSGVEMVITYMPRDVEAKARDKYITSVTEQAIECACFFGPVKLSNVKSPLNLSTCGQSNLNPGLKLLARRYEQMPLYNITVSVETPAEDAPAPFVPYKMLKQLMQHVDKTDFGSRLVGVVAHNQYECLACIEAGFFPVESDGDETLYIKTR